jgi:hypothetical protein
MAMVKAYFELKAQDEAERAGTPAPVAPPRPPTPPRPTAPGQAGRPILGLTPAPRPAAGGEVRHGG